MIKKLNILIFCIALTACASSPFLASSWTRAGDHPLTTQSNLNRCSEEALTLYPPSLIKNPTQIINGSTYCSGSSSSINCRTNPSIILEGNTEDSNHYKRFGHVYGCMSNMGYAKR